jgi:hypothetical protein
MNIGINQNSDEQEEKRTNFVSLDQVINGQKSKDNDKTGYCSQWNPGLVTRFGVFYHSLSGF